MAKDKHREQKQELPEAKPAKEYGLEEGNTLGITSLILGILGLTLFWLGLGIVFGGFGILFAALQKKKYTNPVATAGLITSVLSVALSIIMIALIMLAYPLLMSI